MKNYLILSTITLILTGGFSAAITAQNTCVSPIIIPGIPFSSGYLSTCGTGNDYEQGTYCDFFYGDGEDFVYQLEITSPATYTFVLAGASAGKIMSVHSACPPDQTNCVGNIVTGLSNIGYSNITFSTAGTYYIIIDTWLATDCGQFSLNIIEVPGLVPNAQCDNALILPAGPVCIPTIGTTNGALDDDEPGDCFNNGTENTVWYQFEATNDTHLVIVQGVLLFDAIIGASNDCMSNSRPPGGVCTDDTDGSGMETMLLTDLIVGEQYFIQVSDFEGDILPTSLFTICITDPLANDICEKATDLGLFPVTITGSNLGANDEGIIARASCDNVGIAAINDVWYKFTTNETGGDVTVIFSDNTFDGVLTVYSACNTASEIDCADAHIVNLPEIINLTDLDPNTVYYIRIYSFEGDQGTFNLSISGSALPIELQSFTGKALEKTNLLTWTTVSEKNVAWHIIERSSNGTGLWKEIGKIQSNGGTRFDQKYSLEDELPLAKGFYRLRTIDTDGHSNLSNSIVITRTDSYAGIINVFPNPASNMVTVKFNALEESDIEIIVTDVSGKKVLRQNMVLAKGTNMLPVHVDRLIAGSYILTVVGSNIISEPVRLVKE